MHTHIYIYICTYIHKYVNFMFVIRYICLFVLRAYSILFLGSGLHILDFHIQQVVPNAERETMVGMVGSLNLVCGRVRLTKMHRGFEVFADVYPCNCFTEWVRGQSTAHKFGQADSAALQPRRVSKVDPKTFRSVAVGVHVADGLRSNKEAAEATATNVHFFTHRYVPRLAF